MKNTCPKCETAYQVTSKDVGRRIVCKRCSAVLAINESGFVMEEEPTPMPSQVHFDEAPTQVADEPKREKGEKSEKSEKKKKSLADSVDVTMLKAFADKYIDIPTILFGIGAFFILFFAFMPNIGKAKTERRQGLLAEGQFDHDQEVRKLKEKTGNDEKIKQAEEKWTKQRVELENDIKYAEFGNQQTTYRERYGSLFGFLVLMVGSLGLMRSDSGLVKRIFGAVVLAAQLLLVFSGLIGGCGARLP